MSSHISFVPNMSISWCQFHDESVSFMSWYPRPFPPPLSRLMGNRAGPWWSLRFYFPSSISCVDFGTKSLSVVPLSTKNVQSRSSACAWDIGWSEILSPTLTSGIGCRFGDHVFYQVLQEKKVRIKMSYFTSGKEGGEGLTYASLVIWSFFSRWPTFCDSSQSSRLGHQRCIHTARL